MNRTAVVRRPRRVFRERAWPFGADSPETFRVLPVALPVILVGAGGIAAATISIFSDRPDLAAVAGTLGLLGAAAVAEAFPLPIEGVSVGATSLATVFIVAAAAIYGWESAAIVAFVAMALVELARRKPLLRVLYNTALYVTAASTAGIAANIAGGDDLASIVAGALAAAVAFYLVDIILLSAVVARARGEAFVTELRLYVYSTAVPFLVIASLTVTLVLLWDRSPFLAVLLVGPLLAIAVYQRWLYDALQRLREFDRMKDEFVAVISHELRTPLTSVYGAALTLREQNLDDETRSSLLEIVSNEAGRLAHLLDDVLWASRLDTGRDEGEIVPTNAVALATDVVEAARTRAPTGIAVELVHPPDLPQVAADPDKLRRVLVNLVENGIKYSPDGGRVLIELGARNHRLRAKVCDEGLGIPLVEQDRIFEKFHRLDPRMTRGVSGSGLGLYICRELVERMGGRIWVTSREGKGSTFVFEIPLADEAA